MIDWMALGVGVATAVGVPLAKKYAAHKAGQLIDEVAQGFRRKAPPAAWDALEAVIAERAKAQFEKAMVELAAKAESIVPSSDLPPVLADMKAKRDAAIARGKAAAKPRGRK